MGRVQCRECGEWFNGITALHVKKHGLSLGDYFAKYGNVTSKEAIEKTRKFPAKELLLKAVEDLSPEEKKDLAIKSDLRIMGRDFTKKAAETYYVLLISRLEMFMKSVEVASKILNDLNQPWRTSIDEDGKPLKIADKIRIGEFATSTMEKISQNFGQLLQWAISENKVAMSRPQISSENIFSGQWDKLPQLIPDPMQREKVRVLTEMMVTKIAQMQSLTENMGEDKTNESREQKEESGGEGERDTPESL